MEFTRIFETMEDTYAFHWSFSVICLLLYFGYWYFYCFFFISLLIALSQSFCYSLLVPWRLHTTSFSYDLNYDKACSYHCVKFADFKAQIKKNISDLFEWYILGIKIIKDFRIWCFVIVSPSNYYFIMKWHQMA